MLVFEGDAVVGQYQQSFLPPATPFEQRKRPRRFAHLEGALFEFLQHSQFEDTILVEFLKTEN